MILKIKKLHKDAIIPKYATSGSVAFDVCALEDYTIFSDVIKVRTGLAVQLPTGYELQVRQRSGMSCEYKNYIANCIGTIDSDYRGEIMVPISNNSNKRMVIQKGDKIAQCLVKKCEIVKFLEVDELDKTERGAGGFGHTGR